MQLPEWIIAIATAVYAVIKLIAPDFPLSEEVFLALIAFILGRLGFLSVKMKQAEVAKQSKGKK